MTDRGGLILSLSKDEDRATAPIAGYPVTPPAI